MSLLLNPIGTYASGAFDQGAAEINAFDPLSQRLFVVNAQTVTVDILDLSDPTLPTKLGTIDATSYGGVANSVAVKNGIIAVAIEANTKTDPGQVVFFEASTGNFLKAITVGALPDMVTFTPDGTKVLVANEGEPGSMDPVGSISIIDLSSGVASATVQTAGFDNFIGQEASLRSQGVRIFPNKTAAEDFEPEYISVSPDGTKAFVTLQENNAVAVVDIASATVTEIQPLGTKDHSQPGNGLDASDRDNAINIVNWPVSGLYMPDAIASFSANGQTYYITANEGDARNEDVRVKDLTLDPTVFSDAAILQEDAILGRLTVSSLDGDPDGDGDYDQLYSYGSRSFSIWDASGNQVYDSGDAFERITAERFPTHFNASNTNTTLDNRSDDKGPEPEGVTLGQIDGRTYAFIGLERIGGVMVYDVTDPAKAAFVDYFNNRDFSESPELASGVSNPAALDSGPEGLTFISAEDSPNGTPLLVVSNEISGTTTVYEVKPKTFTLQLLHASDQEGGIAALDDAPNFSAVLNALANQDQDGDGNADYVNTLRLSSGDAYIPGLFLDASADPSLAPLLGATGKGRADILIQNELGFEAIAFGNHEFDLGTGLVQSVLTADGNYPGAAFPYLSSNLNFRPDANLAPLVTLDGQEASTIPGKIAKSAIVTVNGEPIGIVGATTPTLGTISSPGDVGVSPFPFGGSPSSAELDALAAEIQTTVDALLAANPALNKVILLAHMQQIGIEQELAQRLRNVDIIMAGGSNTRLVDSDDRLRAGDTAQGVYPIVQTDADGKPVAIVNTDGNYKYVGRLVIDFDANGNIIPESYNPSISGAYATDAAGVAAVGGTPDPEIVAITDALREVITRLDSNFFGVTDVFLNGNRAGGGTDGVRNQETNLGNLTADANLAIAQQVDPTVVISLKNGGGVRASIGRIETPTGAVEPERLPPAGNDLTGKPEGGISQIDVQNTLAFNNGLSLVTVTAVELRTLIEYGIAASTLDPASAEGRFPQVSGFSFSFDLSQPEGPRIQSLAIEDPTGKDLDVVVRDGQIVGDPSRTFRMVTLDFLASGGDGYPFETLANPNRLDITAAAADPKTGTATFAPDHSEQDALAEYLAANFTEANPYDRLDTPRELDTRIQNLAFRNDLVLDTPTITKIHTIQGNATTQTSGGAHDDVSPLNGQTVTLEGVVVAGFQNGDQLRGFFLQEETADQDSDSSTSEGIFIFTGNSPLLDVQEGQKIRITGKVSEFFGMTQIDATATGSAISLVDSGNNIGQVTTATLALPVTGDLDDYYEQFEGMRVQFADKLYVSEYFEVARYGQIVLTEGDRPFQYTHLDDTPTAAEFTAFQENLARQRIILDDDNNLQNPPLPDGTFFYPQPDGLSTGSQGSDFFRGGDSISNLTGILHWSFAGQSGTDAWRVRPTEASPVVFTPENLRPETPEAVGGNLKVASFNVLNYFTSIDDGSNTAGPNGDQEGRGADSADELTRQTQKLVQALKGIDADIFGLVELENNGGDADGGAIQAVVDALNAEVGAGTYDSIKTGDVGTDAITVGFIYKASVVAPKGNFAVLDDPAFTDPNGTGTPRNRPAIAQTFEVIDPNNPDFGEALTVVNNHFKSKGASGLTAGGSEPDADQGDGQGFWNDTRAKAATYLAQTWLPSDPTGQGDEDFLIIGDLNSYRGEAPITAFKNAGYTDLAASLIGDDAYSYVFNGQLGYLDYALSSPTLTPQVTGITEWHINADEVPVFDYNNTLDDGAGEASFEAKPTGNNLFEVNAFRTSDHDPVIIGLDLGSAITEILGTDQRETLTGSAGPDRMIGNGGTDQLTGNGGADEFVYRKLGDGRDTITDFTPGEDRLVLTELFAGSELDYAGAIANQYLSFGSRNGDSYVLVDLDGAAGNQNRPIAIAVLQGVAQEALADSRNFIL